MRFSSIFVLQLVLFQNFNAFVVFGDLLCFKVYFSCPLCLLCLSLLGHLLLEKRSYHLLLISLLLEENLGLSAWALWSESSADRELGLCLLLRSQLLVESDLLLNLVFEKFLLIHFFINFSFFLILIEIDSSLVIR